MLVMYSGGKDSMLAMCRLISQGYKVYAVTYSNGCDIGNMTVYESVNDLKSLFGDMFEYIGIVHIIGNLMEFRYPFFATNFSEHLKTYGDLSISQINCLFCRTAMYINSIAICNVLGVEYIAEGARKDQDFIIEQDSMISRFRTLAESYGMKLETPMLNYDGDNIKRIAELSCYGMRKSYMEPQCLLGVPYQENEEITEQGICNVFDKYVMPIIKDNKLVEKMVTIYRSQGICAVNEF